MLNTAWIFPLNPSEIENCFLSLSLSVLSYNMCSLLEIIILLFKMKTKREIITGMKLKAMFDHSLYFSCSQILQETIKTMSMSHSVSCKHDSVTVVESALYTIMLL